MRVFKVVIGVMFLLWSGACAVNACGLFGTLSETNRVAGSIDPNANSVQLLSWGFSILMALGTFGVGGYLITKR